MANLEEMFGIPPAPQVSDDILRWLERTTAAVMAGKVKSVAFVYTAPTGEVGLDCFVGEGENPVLFTGAVNVLHFQMTHDLNNRMMSDIHGRGTQEG